MATNLKTLRERMRPAATRRGILAALLFAAILGLTALPAAGQACYTASASGAASVRFISGGPNPADSPLSDTGAIDQQYYTVSPSPGSPGNGTPSVLGAISTMAENGFGNYSSGPVYYGAVFTNPTASPVTVTQADLVADQAIFWDIYAGVAPDNNWALAGSWWNSNDVEWTGSVTVAPYSALSFVVATYPEYSRQPLNANITVTVATSAGTFSSASFSQQFAGGTGPYAANVVAGFDGAGAASYTLQNTVAGVASGSTQAFYVRVAETGNNYTGQGYNDIATPLSLTVTIPAGWSSVSVSASAPWNPNTVQIIQPTAATPGSVTLQTNQNIINGTSTPAGSLIIDATAPTVGQTSLTEWDFSLNGQTVGKTKNGGNQGHAPIASFDQSIVQVTGQGANSVQAVFTSPTIGPGPVRQLAFQSVFDVQGGNPVTTVALAMYNNSTGGWDTFSSQNVGSSDVTVNQSYAADFAPYLNASGQMQVRFTMTGSATALLRLDYLGWSMQEGFTVDSSLGSDSNSGDIAHPLATIGAALSRLTSPSQSIYVQVGNSQSGAPYAANLVVSGASSGGTPTCPTLIQGVANSSGQLPLIQGTNPASDVGFDVGAGGANYVTVDGFQIQNTQAALYAEQGASGITFSDCLVSVPTSGYGIIFYANSGSEAKNNKIDGNNNSTFYGIYDYAGTGTLLDGNVVRRMKNAEAVFCIGSSGLVLRRNICIQSYMGIHIAQPAGTVTVSNNDCDSNDYLGIYAEGVTGTVVSTDNILSSNGVGWGWDGSGSVVSDYDDVWNNKSDYVFHGTVAAGAHSISANPLFVQVTDWTQPSFYQLGSGSPCIGTGTNICCGTSMGAVQ